MFAGGLCFSGIVLFLFFVWYVYFTRSRARMRHEVSELLSQYMPLVEQEEDAASLSMHPGFVSTATTFASNSAQRASTPAPPRSPVRRPAMLEARVSRDVEMEEFGLMEAVAASSRPNPLASSASLSPSLYQPGRSGSSGAVGPGLRSSLDAIGLGSVSSVPTPSSAATGSRGSHYTPWQQQQQQSPHPVPPSPSAPPMQMLLQGWTPGSTTSASNSSSEAAGRPAGGYTFVVTPPPV
jgi:cbb3-type cytochrome oxidase subunit 3